MSCSRRRVPRPCACGAVRASAPAWSQLVRGVMRVRWRGSLWVAQRARWRRAHRLRAECVA
eukprot:3773691-Alexandrium_andersonii.AAC.1